MSINKRRSRRSLNPKNPLHITLRSELAKGSRSLMRHRTHIRKVILRSSKRFEVKVYELAICGNHLHLLIKGRRRCDIQSFFRVLAGHIAQEILKQNPLSEKERGGAPKKGCKKNRRKFWSLLLYSRVVSWGRDFGNVSRYIIRNTLEALNLIPYRERSGRCLLKKKLHSG